MKNRHSLSDTHSKGNGRLKGFTRDCIIALCSILSPGFDALTRAYRPSLPLWTRMRNICSMRWKGFDCDATVRCAIMSATSAIRIYRHPATSAIICIVCTKISASGLYLHSGFSNAENLSKVRFPDDERVGTMCRLLVSLLPDFISSI